MREAASGQPIAGFAVRGYRTITDCMFTCAGPLTVVCGPNNAGKSSILSAISFYDECRQAVSGGAPEVKNLPSEALFGIAAPISQEILSPWCPAARQAPGAFARAAEVIADEGLDHFWAWIRKGNFRLEFDLEETLRQLGPWFERANTDGFLSAVFGRHLKSKAFWNGLFSELPPVDVRGVPDVRRLNGTALSDDDLWKLAQAASITVDDAYRSKWASSLEQVLKDVFGPDVTYRVHPEANSGRFVLRLDGQPEVPLEHVGAGVREVVALAFLALSTEGATALTIEEPENCLHPSAVRRLVRSLPLRTGAQLFVTTHSTAVIDAQPDTLVRVRRHGHRSEASEVGNVAERYELVRDLGHRPSELVLTPCAIWVEGPTDRLYLATWLKEHDLHEGEDFQILLYGGALVAHLSAQMEPGECADKLVTTRALARRSVFLVDSDKAHSRATLKPAVRRLKEETRHDPHCTVVVTWGREVENYLPTDLVNDILTDRAPVTESDRRWAPLLQGTKFSSRKMAFARKAIAKLGPEIPPDAKKQISEIATFVSASSPI